MSAPKVAVLNAAKMNFDGKLDFSLISPETVVYETSTAEEVIARTEGMDCVITKELPVTAKMFERFSPTVKLLCEAGTGYNNIDLAAARKKGIAVCNIPAYSTERVAHTAVMLMLMLGSSMGAQVRMLEKGDRSNFTNALMLTHEELNGKTLGVVGEGNIGKKVISIARALDMNVLVYTRTKRPDGEGVTHVSLEELLKQSDYVSLHCPLNPSTKHIIDADALKLMKPTACIINTARGALINEPALIEALQNGTLRGAGLDVQETEPPKADNPLYDMPNVVLTPHMGWKGKETRERLVSILAADVQGFFGGNPVNVVS